MMSDSFITGTSPNKSVSELSFPTSLQEVCLDFKDTFMDTLTL